MDFPQARGEEAAHHGLNNLEPDKFLSMVHIGASMDLMFVVMRSANASNRPQIGIKYWTKPMIQLLFEATKSSTLRPKFI